MATHYQTLGLGRGASTAEVKSAYRKIVLAHHPDTSKDPRSPAVFLAATAAYDVLSDSAAKSRYDAALDEADRRAAERTQASTAAAGSATNSADAGFRIRYPNGAEVDPKPSAPRPGWTEVRVDPPNVAVELRKLQDLFARGRHLEAEKIARQILEFFPRQPEPYAVLGDMARSRGDVNEAAKMYAYAAQFEPNNSIYQRRYEQLLTNTQVVGGRGNRTQLSHEDKKVLAPMGGAAIIFAMAIYLALSHDNSIGNNIGGKLSLVSSWTPGLVVIFFLTGICVGASLAMGNLLDRLVSLTTTATGRLGPVIALGLIAVLNFWVAAALYLILGVFQRAFNFSASRIMLGIAMTLSVLSLASLFTRQIEPSQVLIWGGNVEYLGAIVGWAVADSFRP